jgi:hypothetical protein
MSPQPSFVASLISLLYRCYLAVLAADIPLLSCCYRTLKILDKPLDYNGLPYPLKAPNSRWNSETPRRRRPGGNRRYGAPPRLDRLGG